MFYGQYLAPLDLRSRFVLPKEIRQSLINQREVLLDLGHDECLVGYDKATWEAMQQPSLEPSDEERKTLRRQFSNMQIVAIDDLGRIVLPQRFVTKLSAKPGPFQIIIVGGGQYFEIWSQQKWEAYGKDFE